MTEKIRAILQNKSVTTPKRLSTTIIEKFADLLMEDSEDNIVEDFTIYMSEITINGLKKLCQVVTKNKTLKKLCIHECFISEEGTDIICELIEKGKNLRHLEFFDTNLYNIEKVFDVLKTNSNLHSLTLNNMDTDNPKILRNLENNTSLLELNIIGSFFNDKLDEKIKNSEINFNIGDILDGLEKNTSLISLNLGDIPSSIITKNYSEIINKFLEKNKTLMYLDFVLRSDEQMDYYEKSEIKDNIDTMFKNSVIKSISDDRISDDIIQKKPIKRNIINIQTCMTLIIISLIIKIIIYYFYLNEKYLK